MYKESEMEKQTIVDNEFITLWYYPEEKIIHHQFHKKTIYGDALRTTFQKGIDLLKENNARKWLSDDKTNVAFTVDDTNWLMHNWSTRALEAGWKFWALVQPEIELGKMNLEQFTSEYAERGLIVKLFQTPEEGMVWLLSV
jgi:hypothetical protein